ERATDEVMLVAALIAAPDGATKVSAIAAGYFGPSAIAERVVKPIKVFDQPVVDTLGPIPYEQLNASLDASFPRGARNYWKSHFCEQLTDEAIETIIDCHRKCPSPMAMASIEHFTVRPHASRPRRPHLRCAGGFNVLALSQWRSPAGDAAGLGWARETDAALTPFGGSSQYVNYLDQDDAGAAALAAAY